MVVGASTEEANFTLDDVVRGIIMNTIIAAAAEGKVDFFHCLNFQVRSNFNERFLDDILGGLVEITNCFNVIIGLGALAGGLTAGVVHCYSFDLVIKKWRIDDAVGAIPVHGFCGVWGVLCRCPV